MSKYAKYLTIAMAALLCIGQVSLLADTAADQKRDIAAAKASISAKDWDKANILVDALVTAYPKDPATPHLLKGAIYQGQGKAQEALDEIKAGLIAGKGTADNGWAIGVLDSVQSANPKPNSEMLEELADCYRIATDFAKGARCYESALSERGVSADRAKRIRRWLIACHIRSKNWVCVEKEIDQIAAESPDCAAWSYYSLGKNYKRYGDYGKAIASFTKAASADKKLPSPDVKPLQTALAESYIGGGQWDNATELIKKLTAQYPGDSGYWHECVGAIYQGQKKYPEAIAELKQAIEPETAITARKRLGECYRDSLEPQAAAPLIQELVDKYPGDGPYLPTIVGRMCQDLKDYDKAIAEFKFVINKFPDARWQVWDACYYIGECCYAQDKGDEALAYIKDFYAKHTDRPMDFAIAYGKTLLRPANKPAEAAQLLAKAIAEHPKDALVPEVRRMLIAAYSDSGQMDMVAEVLDSMGAKATPSEKPGILASLAEHYYSVRKYREAAAMYRAVIAFHNSTRELRARAEYQLGMCYYYSNMDVAARQAMQSVAQQYAGLELAKQAQAMLYLWDNLGRDTR